MQQASEPQPNPPTRQREPSFSSARSLLDEVRLIVEYVARVKATEEQLQKMK